jgi:hypothetical protein
VEQDAKTEALTINCFAVQSVRESEQAYISAGGELIKLPSSEYAKMMQILASVAPDVSGKNPQLAAAYKIVADAAARTR